MASPNFFLIGASKSATTSLYHYLGQHPEIYMCPKKEPAYFIFENNKLQDNLKYIEHPVTGSVNKNDFINFKEYIDLYKKVEGEKIIGEASPQYLYFRNTAQRIYDFLPSANIVAILRNPFDAAYSQFRMLKQDGYLRYDSFIEALKAEDWQSDNECSSPDLIRSRFYDIQIQRYLDLFLSEKVRIYLYEDLKDTERFFSNIFQFLEVSDKFVPDVNLQFNIGESKIKSRMFYRFIYSTPNSIRNQLKYFLPPFLFKKYMNFRSGISEEKIATTKKCPPEAKAFLKPIFEPHILQLENLIHRDLSHWLK